MVTAPIAQSHKHPLRLHPRTLIIFNLKSLWQYRNLFVSGLLFTENELLPDRPQTVAEAIAIMLLAQRIPLTNESVAANIPLIVQERMQGVPWPALIGPIVASRVHLTENEARRQFLEHLGKHWTMFGAALFQVREASHPQCQGGCILGVSSDALRLVNLQSRVRPQHHFDLL
jgi:hypothetical protein